MSKANGFETNLLKLIFLNVALPNIGDASGIPPSGADGNLYIALYTTDPTDADTGTEASFVNYARVAVPRAIPNWGVSGNTCSNLATITFPTSAGPNQTITHFGIRTAASGGDLLYHGELTFPALTGSGDTVKFNSGDLTVTEE